MSCAPWTATYPCDVEGVDPTLLDLATNVASLLLWSLTGRRFGTCTATTLYRVASCAQAGSVYPYKGRDGQWRNAICDGECCRIELLHQPVQSVESVTIDGTALDASEWWLEGQSVRVLDGCPVCNECGPAPIEVAYTYNIPVPPEGELAVGEMACEFVKGWNGGSCKLSSRAVSVTRQGVTIDLLDAADLFEQGLTGLPLADAFIRSVNPGKLAQRSRVLSPDMPRVVG